MKIYFRFFIFSLCIMCSCQHKSHSENDNPTSDKTNLVDQPKKEAPEEQKKIANIAYIDFLSHSEQNDIILILENSKKISLAFFPDTEYAVSLIDTIDKDNGYIHPVKKQCHDFDNDGRDELVLQYYSGGAHCCTENYIFRQIAKNRFKQIFFNEGGNMEIVKSKICIDVSEKLGYFYACYACQIGESLLGENIIPKAELEINNGKFRLVGESNKKVNKKLIGYLEKLSKRPVPPLAGEMNFDDGTRKLYALLIMEYFFNNKCDMEKCKKLFFKYYKANDSKSIWIEIKNSIENCFELELSDFPVFNHSKK